MEFRFNNEWIDSTVAVQEDGSVIEVRGSGGEVVKKPQTFPTVEDWLNVMAQETALCCREWDNEAAEYYQSWYTPTTYSCGKRVAEDVFDEDGEPTGEVSEGSCIWLSPAEWAASVRTNTVRCCMPIRRSPRLAAKAAKAATVMETLLPLPSLPDLPSVPASLSEEEKRMVAHIKGFLERVEAAKGPEIKAAISAELFHFVAVFGKEFCAKHTRFRDTVIAKAHEFKKHESDRGDLMKAADTVLLALSK